MRDRVGKDGRRRLRNVERCVRLGAHAPYFEHPEEEEPRLWRLMAQEIRPGVCRLAAVECFVVETEADPGASPGPGRCWADVVAERMGLV